MKRPQEPIRRPHSTEPPKPFHRIPVQVGEPKIYYSGSRINETENGFTEISVNWDDIHFTDHVYKEVPNKSYETQKKMYDDYVAKYEKDRIEYEKAMVEYNKFMKNKQEQEELKLYKKLKKKFEHIAD